MEFTEIHELNHFIKLNQHQDRLRANSKQYPLTPHSQPNTQATSIIKNILSFKQSSEIEIIFELEHYASSYYSGISQMKQVISPLIDTKGERQKAKTQLPNIDNFDFEQARLLFSRKKIVENKQRGSVIGRLSRIRTTSKLSVYEKKVYKLKLFYFNSKAHKIVEYDSQATAQVIIKKGIALYLSDNSLDQTLLPSISKQAYDLCICDDDSYTRDEDIPPLSLKKNIKQLNVEVLTLIKNDRDIQESQQLIDQYLTMNGYDRKSIIVMNQFGEEFLKINLELETSVSLIYQKIQKMNDNYEEDKFYLVSEQGGDESKQIMRDQKVNDIPGILYIRIKKYADQAIPIMKNITVQDLPEGQQIQGPMGINQASMYQQFPVVKINRWGAKQNRILGIDQIKIYNYDSELRSEDKQLSFFNKMFGNLNENFGTKTPQRLISDIANIKEISQKNLLVIQFSNVFSSKSLQFEIEPKIRKKIIQKLRVLTNNNQNRII